MNSGGNTFDKNNGRRNSTAMEAGIPILQESTSILNKNDSRGRGIGFYKSHDSKKMPLLREE